MGHVSYIPGGRAGNGLFQIAAAWSLAKKHGMEFSCPLETSSNFWSPLLLKHLQNHNYNPALPAIHIREAHFHYAPLPFEESWRGNNIILSGYFQAPQYFDEYREEMLAGFNLPWEHRPDICSLHARYGDYLEIPGKHIIVNEPYIVEAMKIITEKTGITRFKVFSDDLNLFKQRHGHLYDFEYSSNGEIMEDLIEISCCHSHISSSSTFSWWSTYLNKNPDKVIVAQSRWFRENWDNADTKDIILPTWIKLDLYDTYG